MEARNVYIYIRNFVYYQEIEENTIKYNSKETLFTKRKNT